jgi:hypothetical protein
MKKILFTLFGIYLLIIGIFFLLGWLYSKTTIPQYSLNQVHYLLPDKFHDKKVTAIQYIERTNEAYIFTDSNDFYILDIRSMKEIYYHKLLINSKVKNIKCIENRCVLLTQNTILHLNINNYKSRTLSIVPDTFHNATKDIDKIVYYNGRSTLIIKTKNKFISYYKRTNLPTILQRIQQITNTSDIEFISEDYSFCSRAYYKEFMRINFIELHDHNNYHIRSFLNLYNIKALAIDRDVFYSPLPKNVIFINAQGELYQAKTTSSFLQDIYNFTRPFAYLPMLVIMMFAG